MVDATVHPNYLFAQRFPIARTVAVAGQRPLDLGWLDLVAPVPGGQQILVDTDLEWSRMIPVKTGGIPLGQQRQRRAIRRRFGNGEARIGHAI